MSEEVLLITGAAGRIGSSIARAVLTEGWNVVLVDVDETNLTRLQQGLDSQRVLSICADAGLPRDADRSLSLAKAHYGKVDAAIHCAYPKSSGWGTEFERMKKLHLDEDLTCQLGGAILFSQRVLEFFREQGYGNLIHVASIMGVTTPKFENYVGTQMTSPIEYTAMKAGLIAATKYLSKYYRGSQIRVNCISPGGIFDGQPESFLKKYRTNCNSKGVLDPEDLVGTVLYLISQQSQYVTGQNIVIDDGWSL